MQERRSRTALTSGDVEPVADGGGSGHSIFAKVFLEVLRKNKGFLDGDSLFDKIKEPVALYADQTPRYGNIKKADQVINIQQGDFIFVPKRLQDVRLKKKKEVKKTGGRIDLSYLQRGGQGDKKIGQYIAHGNGTVTDTKTGLMWKRCSEGLSGDNCEHGKAEEYTYDDAVKRFKHVAYAGYSDWRLPTIDELRTLVYCSNGTSQQDAWDKGCNKDYSSDGLEIPTINQQAFPNTFLDWAYWSGSPLAYYSDSAWSVYFNFGYSGVGSRSNDYAVRLVRGGQ
ncbi:MAG: DUF1566 domain-containing protein [Candidatus Electrothrix sp. AW5]|nr:DUF1566 domain-containing protein [Candidatus Electrothrix gigas]